MRTVVIELGVNRPKYIEGPLKEYPDIIFYGFDPSPYKNQAEGLKGLEEKYANFHFINKAAWVRNEKRKLVVMGQKGVGSTIVDKQPPSKSNKISHVTTTDCIDLDIWIKENLLPEDCNILRADIEGTEYYLFPHMIEQGSMRYFKSVMFEPHYNKMKHRAQALETHQSILSWFAENNIYVTTEFKDLFSQQDFISQ